MIERIVLLQMTEEFATEAALAEVAERSREVLPKLPGVLACHVGLAADERTRVSWHIALVLRFAAADDIPPHATSKWSAPSGFRHRDNGSVVNVAPILGRAGRGDGTARKGPSL